MAISKNKCEFIGNVTRNPELRYLSSGMAVADVGVAVNESYKNKNDEWIEETLWLNCVAWGKTAERVVAQYKKGDRIYIETKLKIETWEDKNTAEKRSAPKFTILDHWPLAKDVKLGDSVPQPSDGYSTGGEDEDEDLDIPF